MNNRYGAQFEIELNLIDLIWKLLMQWKAILILCVAMGILAPGIKYYKDNNAYKAELAARKEAEEQLSLPAEERIEAALSALPAEQHDDVLFAVQEQDLITKQKEYLNDSILLNLDPSRQRQLVISYVIKSDKEMDMRALADAYSTLLCKNDVLIKLRDIIDPDARLDYIDELIDAKNEYLMSGDVSSALYTVNIVLPENVDADAVLSLVDSEFNNNHDELNSVVGDHSIGLLNSEDRIVFNKDIADRRSGMTNTINNLSNNLDAVLGRLNAEQQSVYEKIILIKEVEKNSIDDNAGDTQLVSSSQPNAPVFSKKYAVLGLFLGGIIYAGMYIVILIMKKTVFCVSAAQKYTCTRLLGEVYPQTKHSGLKWLFTSDILAKLRYKDRLDVEKQISSLAATVDAVCVHHATSKLTLMLSGLDHGFDDIVDRIVIECNSVGNKKNIDLINADTMDEAAFGSVKDVVYVLCNKSKIDNLNNLLSLIGEYDVIPLGTIYLEEL